MRNNQQSYYPGGHLSREQLVRYLANQLAASEELKIRNHLLDCRLCKEALEGMETMENPLHLSRITRRLHSRAFHKFLKKKNNFFPISPAIYLAVIMVLGIIVLFSLWFFRR